jgi:hypothetical protein
MNIRTCTKCLIEKSIDQFAWKNKAAGIRQYHCLECVSIKSKEWYFKNKQTHIERAARIGKAKRSEVRDYVVSLKLSCSECGESHPATLDFHHLFANTKEANVADMIGSGFSKKRIIEEINKCVVLCSNCHRKLHWNIRNKFSP